MVIKKVSSLLLFSFVMLFVIKSAYPAEIFTAYLFAFFKGNATVEEAIHFALSDDAHAFKQLNNGKPILSSAKISLEGGVRDPHILRGVNNDYYMVATDMVAAKGWASNHGIVMLKSTNLIDWKSSAVDIRTAFSKYQVADRVWAPQTIYDPVAKKYMVYFAMRLGSTDVDKIYYSYADSTFTKLETAPELLYKYGNNSAIDADIICKDSLYYLFFKTEGSGNGIKSATSKKLTEGYVLYDKYLQATAEQVEGSCAFKLINSNTYLLMYDVYNSKRYEFATSTDLKTFTKDPKPISFDFTPRHGTVIQITSAEKKALLAKWDPTGIAKEPVKTALFVKHYFRGNSLNLMFGKFTSNVSVGISDLLGRTVLNRFTSEKSIRIELTTIPAGVYHVLCRSENGDLWSIMITVQ